MIKAAGLMLLALAFPAGAFELAFPADCDLGETCFIQQYMDHDPGPAATDFTCGPLVYNGHFGTDIALENRAQMQAGVAVLAAGPGTVKGLRDGTADFAPYLPGQNCGNGVVVDHGGGWETQYCHLRQGSVAVSVGQAVDTGTVLGMIGQSGQADFPHLHLSLRRRGAEIDPFAPNAPTTCGPNPAPGLWSAPIRYVPGGIISIGLTQAIPDYDSIKAGLPSPDLASTAPALVVWAHVYGARAGDALVINITGPQGDIITERIVLEKTQAQLFRAVGKKLHAAVWPTGPYTGRVTMLRTGQQIDAETLQITVKN